MMFHYWNPFILPKKSFLSEFPHHVAALRKDFGLLHRKSSWLPKVNKHADLSLCHTHWSVLSNAGNRRTDFTPIPFYRLHTLNHPFLCSYLLSLSLVSSLTVRLVRKVFIHSLQQPTEIFLWRIGLEFSGHIVIRDTFCGFFSGSL